jgi:hypothetical protein
MPPKALARHLEPFVAKILFAAYNLGWHYYPQSDSSELCARRGNAQRCVPDRSDRTIPTTSGAIAGGLYAWQLTNFLQQRTPIPAKGHLTCGIGTRLSMRNSWLLKEKHPGNKGCRPSLMGLNKKGSTVSEKRFGQTNLARIYIATARRLPRVLAVLRFKNHLELLGQSFPVKNKNCRA